MTTMRPSLRFTPFLLTLFIVLIPDAFAVENIKESGEVKNTVLVIEGDMQAENATVKFFILDDIEIVPGKVDYVGRHFTSHWSGVGSTTPRPCTDVKIMCTAGCVANFHVSHSLGERVSSSYELEPGNTFPDFGPDTITETWARISNYYFTPSAMGFHNDLYPTASASVLSGSFMKLDSIVDFDTLSPFCGNLKFTIPKDDFLITGSPITFPFTSSDIIMTLSHDVVDSINLLNVWNYINTGGAGGSTWSSVMMHLPLMCSTTINGYLFEFEMLSFFEGKIDFYNEINGDTITPEVIKGLVTGIVPPEVPYMGNTEVYMILSISGQSMIPTDIIERDQIRKDWILVYPNPVTRDAIINYKLPKDCNIDIAVYDLRGERVRTLYNGKEQAGNHRLTWNGSDDDGNRLKGGIYLISVKSVCYSFVKKMIMIG
jgi:hypothetical protein